MSNLELLLSLLGASACAAAPAIITDSEVDEYRLDRALSHLLIYGLLVCYVAPLVFIVIRYGLGIQVRPNDNKCQLVSDNHPHPSEDLPTGSSSAVSRSSLAADVSQRDDANQYTIFRTAGPDPELLDTPQPVAPAESSNDGRTSEIQSITVNRQYKTASSNTTTPGSYDSSLSEDTNAAETNKPTRDTLQVVDVETTLSSNTAALAGPGTCVSQVAFMRNASQSQLAEVVDMTALSSDAGSYDIGATLHTSQSAPAQTPFSSNTAALDAPGSSVSQVARTHDASQVPLALEFVETPFLSSDTAVLRLDDVVAWTDDAGHSAPAQIATTSSLSSDTATAELRPSAVACPFVEIETPFLSSDSTATLGSPRPSLSDLSGTTASLGADVETPLPSNTATLDAPGSSLSEYASRAWRASQYTLVEADRVRAASVPWSSSETLVPVRPGGSLW